MKRTIAAAAASLAALGLAAAPAIADVIRGTDGNDRLVGERRASDFLIGMGGDDHLDGKGGGDEARGGGGDDWIRVGRIHDGDRFESNAGKGGEGDDVLISGSGRSDFASMVGNSGNDVIRNMPGGTSNDYGRGHRGNDSIRLGRGYDSAEPDTGNDVVKTGGRSDYVYLYPDGVRDRVWCGAGRDYVMAVGGKVENRDQLVGCERIERGNRSDLADARVQAQARAVR